eukprot:6206704-Pleurochrysis_carterae.AAC.4
MSETFQSTESNANVTLAGMAPLVHFQRPSRCARPTLMNCNVVRSPFRHRSLDTSGQASNLSINRTHSSRSPGSQYA